MKLNVTATYDVVGNHAKGVDEVCYKIREYQNHFSVEGAAGILVDVRAGVCNPNSDPNSGVTFANLILASEDDLHLQLYPVAYKLVKGWLDPIIKINMIKVLRERTGVGLMPAKKLIEAALVGSGLSAIARE